MAKGVNRSDDHYCFAHDINKEPHIQADILACVSNYGKNTVQQMLVYAIRTVKIT